LQGALTGVEVPTEWLIDHPHDTWYGLTTATT
jgi:hypothetical protein